MSNQKAQPVRPATRKESQIVSMYQDLIKAGLNHQEAAHKATERGVLMDFSRLEELTKAAQ